MSEDADVQKIETRNQLVAALEDEWDEQFEKAEAKYIEAGGVECLYCGSSAGLEGGSIDIEFGEAHQEITCSECGRDWVDSYKLVGVIE